MFRGEAIGSRPPYEIARRGLGRTFQHVKLIPQMTVVDNVAIGAHLRGKRGTVAAMMRLDREEEARLLKEAAGQPSPVPLKSAGLGIVNSGRPHTARTTSMPMALNPSVNIS